MEVFKKCQKYNGVFQVFRKAYSFGNVNICCQFVALKSTLPFHLISEL